MYCPECGVQVEKSFKFCPECGFKLSVLTQNRTQHGATSAHHSSVSAKEKSQKDDQNQVPKDIEDELENTAHIKGKPANDGLEPAKDGSTQQDPSDNTVSPATLQKGDTPSSSNHSLLSGESVTSGKSQVTETCKEQESLSDAAPKSKSQPCSEAVPDSNLYVSWTPPSSTLASDKLTEHQKESPPDISTEDSPDAVQIPADEQSSIDSEPSKSMSCLTLTEKNSSAAPELSEQTSQEYDLVAKQSEQDKNETVSHAAQNLFGKPDDKANLKLKANLDSFLGQPDSDGLQPARDGSTSQDPSDNTPRSATLAKGATPSSPVQTHSTGQSVTSKKLTETCKEEERLSATAVERNSQPCNEAVLGSNLSVSMTPPSPTPASDKQTEQKTEAPSGNRTEDSTDAVQIPVDKSSDIHSGPSNSVSSVTSTKETGSSAPELAEQKLQECDSLANQFASEKDKTVPRETQNLSARPDDNENHTNNEQHTFTKQTDRKEDQCTPDPCPATKETVKGTKEPFLGYPLEYQKPLTEEDKIEVKGFVSRGNVDQWLLEMHEFLLLSLGRLWATDDYKPSWK